METEIHVGVTGNDVTLYAREWSNLTRRVETVLAVSLSPAQVESLIKKLSLARQVGA